jgi:hypothetical protein
MLSRIKFDIDPLVNEILDQIPEEVWNSRTSKFLDQEIGGGQFIRAIEQRLRQAGHSDKNISGRVYGCSSSKLSVQYAKNKYKLAATLSVDDFLTRDFNGMKFNIVGNPPYQSSTGSLGGGATPLYIKFVEKAQSLVADDGYIALVTPPTAFKIGMGGYVNPKEVISINNDVKQYFKVGSSFWYFVQQKNRVGSTEITKNNVKYTVDIKSDTILTAENKLENSILNKLQRFSGGVSLKDIKRNVTPLPKNAVFIRRMNRNKTFNAILTYTGMENDVKLNQDYTMIHEHAAQIVETLNSKVYTFLWQRYQTSPFITLEWIRSLNVPLSDVNEELKLTKKEIEYLEQLDM